MRRNDLVLKSKEVAKKKRKKKPYPMGRRIEAIPMGKINFRLDS
ncbi:hypothetical protein VII00023_04108 [Vibrio ichthyoenteri ATCC 700023]|uniref:Uncharacterized protein n=1 Tax=Vibrio ichthyoenteri ATCC 700023 TaxID=870968 RepID=F9S0A2_9VIBR|nr:hypothetical protein VII00023_04108 [Vibrio ichthyoenteri ATCC 700023]